jgi:hypothetical protein
MWPLRSLYEQTAFYLGRVNKSIPYLAVQQHLWLFVQQYNSSLWKAGRYWKPCPLLSVTLSFLLRFKELYCILDARVRSYCHIFFHWIFALIRDLRDLQKVTLWIHWNSFRSMVKSGAGLHERYGLNILSVNETPCLLYTTCGNQYWPAKLNSL